LPSFFDFVFKKRNDFVVSLFRLNKLKKKKKNEMWQQHMLAVWWTVWFIVFVTLDGAWHTLPWRGNVYVEHARSSRDCLAQPALWGDAHADMPRLRRGDQGALVAVVQHLLVNTFATESLAISVFHRRRHHRHNNHTNSSDWDDDDINGTECINVTEALISMEWGTYDAATEQLVRTLQAERSFKDSRSVDSAAEKKEASESDGVLERRSDWLALFVEADEHDPDVNCSSASLQEALQAAFNVSTPADIKDRIAELRHQLRRHRGEERLNCLEAACEWTSLVHRLAYSGTGGRHHHTVPFDDACTRLPASPCRVSRAAVSGAWVWLLGLGWLMVSHWLLAIMPDSSSSPSATATARTTMTNKQISVYREYLWRVGHAGFLVFLWILVATTHVGLEQLPLVVLGVAALTTALMTDALGLLNNPFFWGSQAVQGWVWVLILWRLIETALVQPQRLPVLAVWALAVGMQVAVAVCERRRVNALPVSAGFISAILFVLLLFYTVPAHLTP
jgi:hypothetical protein